MAEQHAEEGKEMAAPSQSMSVFLSPKSLASPFSFPPRVQRFVRVLNAGCGGRAQTPVHRASTRWLRRLAVTLKENSRYKTQGKGSSALVLAWRDLLYEYQLSFILGYARGICSHIEEEERRVREIVGWPLISNSFQAISKSLHHFTERNMLKCSHSK